jgi:Raf kinase inhibitor-like YbhB/YbcL family protein
MNLTIHNFVNSNKKIKKEYLCLSHGGNNICPKMSWNCVDNAKSYVIIMEDPDAAVVSNFVHLFLYIDIINNKSCNTLSQKLYFGKNSLNENSYHGPCAPKNTGVHRYIFTIYALNKKIKFNRNNNKINSSKDFINKIKNMDYNKLNNDKILVLSKDSVQFTYSYL